MVCPAVGIRTVTNIGERYGRHKIPRFIYHMTNKSSYESMLKDGVIKTSVDGTIGKGVFATELTNLFKRWRCNKSWASASLQERLIEQVAKGNDDIVILKIPTDKLNHDKLFIRSQNKLFNWAFSDNFDDICYKIHHKFKHTSEGGWNWLDAKRYLLKKLLYNSDFKKDTRHLTEGAPARFSHLYKQRKHAIEYVYKENIPITNIEKIGEVNVADLRKTSDYDPIRPIRSIFTALLKGNPEVKGAELLNC